MTRTTGVFQLPNGTWDFRYAYWVNGRQKDLKRTTDKNRNPFKIEKATNRIKSKQPHKTTIGYPISNYIRERIADFLIM